MPPSQRQALAFYQSARPRAPPPAAPPAAPSPPRPTHLPPPSSRRDRARSRELDRRARARPCAPAAPPRRESARRRWPQSRRWPPTARGVARAGPRRADPCGPIRACVDHRAPRGRPKKKVSGSAPAARGPPCASVGLPGGASAPPRAAILPTLPPTDQHSGACAPTAAPLCGAAGQTSKNAPHRGSEAAAPPVPGRGRPTTRRPRRATACATAPN